MTWLRVPAIKVTTDHHNIDAGTSTRLTADLMNVAGGSDIKWSVSPNVGKIRVDGPHGTTAVFTADQQGNVQRDGGRGSGGNGHWVSDYTDITVNGLDANGHSDHEQQIRDDFRGGLLDVMRQVSAQVSNWESMPH